MRIVLRPYLETINFVKENLNAAWNGAGIHSNECRIAIYLDSLDYAFLHNVSFPNNKLATLENLKEIMLIPSAEARVFYAKEIGVFTSVSDGF